MGPKDAAAGMPPRKLPDQPSDMAAAWEAPWLELSWILAAAVVPACGVVNFAFWSAKGVL